MERREFLTISSAIMLACVLPLNQANAFVWALMRLLGRSALGRHMSRFGTAGSRLSYSGRFSRGYRTGQKNDGSINKKLKAKEVVVNSKNSGLISKIGEIVFDNVGNGFPSPLEGNVTAVCGGNDSDIFCSSFISSNDNGNSRPVVMELAEIIMLDEVGKQLPEIYKKEFISGNDAETAKKVLSCIHPVTRIKDGEFDDEWNHITPLMYGTVCGRVIIEMMENLGTFTIERDDIQEEHIIPVRFANVDIQTGARS